MSLFLFTFLSIYGAVHFYLFIKARAALSLSFGPSFMMGLFLTVMVVAPIAVRFLERQGLYMIARFSAYIGYTWMGLIFIFFWMGLCLDVFNLGMHLLAILPGSVTGRLVWTGKNAFVFLVLSAVLLGTWSAFNAWQIRLDRVFLQTQKLPSQVERLTIVQISDLHLGMMVGERRLKRILGLVRKAEPDLLVCTGDLVDAQIDHLGRLAEMLAQIQPPLGKFAVVGNHEFYAGIAQSESFLKAAGFKVLRDRRYQLDDLLTIVGVDDPAARRYQGNRAETQMEAALLMNPNSKKFTLLLKHRPLVESESLGRFDLQLSGHTHGGQIFPFSLITGIFYDNQSGLAPLSKGSLLYVSRGAGTWGPPMRLMAAPHVTVIKLGPVETGLRHE